MASEFHVERERNAYGKPSNCCGARHHLQNPSQNRQSNRTYEHAEHRQASLKRAALYARVSTDKQEREDTVANQVERLTPQTFAYICLHQS